MKTKKGWKKSGFDLDQYLDEPCEIDESLFHYILQETPPSYLSPFGNQGLEPQDSFEYDDEKIMLYMTVSNVNGKYFYLGILPEFKG